jgi:hypothetical protein
LSENPVEKKKKKKMILTVGQDLKVQPANIAVSCYKVHAMFIDAISARGSL